MTLTLNMLRCPNTVPPETRTVTGGEFSIGRGAENHWALPDPERFLSKRHCLLAYRSGGWQVADLSTNGTFLNGEPEPIGQGQPRDLRDGDRLRLGAYEIELRIAETAMPRPGSAGRSNPFALDPFAAPSNPATNSLGQDPLLRAAPEHDPFAQALVPPSINLPADYDPLAPEPGDAPFTGPTQPDHSPHFEDAFVPATPRITLPDDWDRDPSAQQSSPSPAPEAVQFAPMAPPIPAAQPAAPAPPQPAAPVPAPPGFFRTTSCFPLFCAGPGYPTPGRPTRRSQWRRSAPPFARWSPACASR